MIEKSESLKVAEKLLREVLPLLRKLRVYQTCWANGREQGFNLTNWGTGRAVVFGQCRGSDQILVVAGPRSEFDGQTGQPSEELWASKGRRYFKDGDYKGAAKFVVKELKA